MENKSNNRWKDELRFVPVDINKIKFANRPKGEKEEEKSDEESPDET